MGGSKRLYIEQMEQAERYGSDDYDYEYEMHCAERRKELPGMEEDYEQYRLKMLSIDRGLVEEEAALKASMESLERRKAEQELRKKEMAGFASGIAAYRRLWGKDENK